MKNLQATAVVALMTAAIGLSAIAPTYAQDAAPPAAPAAEQMPAPGDGPMGPMGGMRHHDGQGHGRQGFADQRQGGPRGMAGFIGFERGSEAVEIALVRLSHAIEMTPEQQALFDTLKTDALAAADKFTTAVEGLRPAAPAAGQQAERPDITKGLETRIAIETAHLDALKSVQPSVTAFFASLTDAQKAQLMPAPHAARADMPGQMGKHGQHPNSQRQGHGKMDGMNGPRGAAPVVPATNG